jgi:hypothetical protein
MCFRKKDVNILCTIYSNKDLNPSTNTPDLNYKKGALDWQVINDTIIDGTISETNRTGEELILPEDLTNITYGSYLLTLTLRGSPNTIETKDMIMFYEEAITGLIRLT